MKAIFIDRDGSVEIREGEQDFWMTEDTSWAETETPALPGHSLYYDDDSLSNPGEVRAIVGGVEVPLPAWLVGIAGNETADVTVSCEEVRKSIDLPVRY